MTYLSEEQQKKLEKIRENIAKVEADIKAIEEKDPADWRSKEELNKQLRDLERQEEEIEEQKRNLESKLESYVTATGSGAPKDVYTVFLPGGSQIKLNYFQLNNIGKQMNIYFARLDNPFLDSYGATQREELVRSILGTPTGTAIPTTPAATITANNNADANWRKKLPQPGKITEPTYQSYEWYQRWWEFLRNYARKELVWGPRNELVKYDIIFEHNVFHDTPYKGLVTYRNTAKILQDNGEDKIYGSWFDDYLPKTKNAKTAATYMFVLGHGKNAQDIGINCSDHIYFSIADWICLFNEEFFPTNTLEKNLLINNSASGTNYKVGPDAWRDTNYYGGLHSSYFTLKSGKTDDFKIGSYDLHGITVDASSNYVDIKPGDEPYRFDQHMAPGIRGMIDLSHDIFDKNNIKFEFYKNEPVISLQSCGKAMTQSGSNTNGTPPSYFTNKKIDISFSIGELPRVDDPSDIRKKIAAKKREIADYDLNAPYKDNDYNTMIAKKRLLNQELIRLRKEEMKLVGEDESEMLSLLSQAERRVNSSGKVSIEDYEYFDASTPTSFYKRFQEIVKIRLVSEKKLTSDEAKTWNFETGKTITNENSDTSLKLRTKFEDARKKREGKIKDLGPVLLRVGSALNRFSGDNKVEQVEKWAKDKKNVQAAQQLLNDLNELESKDIKLSEENKDIREVLRKSDLVTAKDLQGFLTEVWKAGGEAILDQKVLNAFNTYRWRGTKYNEGSNFSRLATHPSDIRNASLGSGNKKLFNLIKDHYNGEVAYDIIGPIYEYRLKEYLGKSSSERDKDYSKEEMLEMLNEAENYYDVNLSGITVGTKTAQDLKGELVKSIGKAKGEALGLDYNRSSELRVIMQWKNYSNEEIREITSTLDEKDKKSTIMSSKPEEVHRKFIDKRLEEFGIKTVADVNNIKATDKDKIAQLDRLEAWLEKAEEKGAATEEHKKLRAAIAAHKVTLAGGDKTGGDKTGGDKTGGDKTGDGKANEMKDDKKWYAKAGYAVIWAPILVIAAIAGIWYFAFRKPEGSESEEGETTEGEATE